MAARRSRQSLTRTYQEPIMPRFPKSRAAGMPPMPEIISDLLDPSCYHLLFRMESGYLNDLVLIPLGLARARRLARALEDAGFLRMRARQPPLGMTGDHIGRSLRRLEDQRFLTGQGRYVDDIAVPGQLHGVVLRSPHGHAVIESIDAAAARAMPGVHGVFTAADLDADGIGTLPCIAQVATVAPMIVPPRRALARDRVRHVGDPVAFVVADTAQQARDAAEQVEVAYRPLPAVVDAREALAAQAPLLWDEAPGNLSYRFERGDKPAVDAAFAGGSPHRRDRAGQQPAGRRPDRAARRDRHLRCCRRPLRPAADRPGRAQPAPAARGRGVQYAARPHHRARARCRRRVRRQEFPLSRMGAGAVGGAAAGPAGQMGRRARRGVRQLRARPRQSYAGAPGARPRRPVSRPRCRHGGQSRRLSVDQRPGQLDQFAGQRDGRGL